MVNVRSSYMDHFIDHPLIDLSSRRFSRLIEKFTI